VTLWSHPIVAPPRRPHQGPAAAVALSFVAILAAGCQNTSLLTQASLQNTTGSVTSPTATAEADQRRDLEALGTRYRANPRDPAAAIAYAQALRAGGQRVQAVSVLEQASLTHPHDKALLGAFGRALADVGYYDRALEVFNQAHSPDQPDWHILSAQGAVLDQLGRHAEAQRYYASALKIKPDDPSVLSNLCLSYALAKDLKNAEATLRRAAAFPGADPRVRQNLALVVGLQGRFAEAETIARADLPSDEAAANVAYLRQMLAQGDDIKMIGRPTAAIPARKT
jgi:Flp pilus assembly protein TadD